MSSLFAELSVDNFN